MFYVSLSLISKISDVKLKVEKKKSFTFTDKTIFCEDSIKLIGKTKDFIFFYNKKLDESFVRPTDNLTNSAFKN